MRVLPFLVRVLWQPEVELDLLTPAGKPDHAKIMGYYLMTNLLLLAWFRRLPEFWLSALICAVGFGWIGLRTILSARKGG